MKTLDSFVHKYENGKLEVEKDGTLQDIESCVDTDNFHFSTFSPGYWIATSNPKTNSDLIDFQDKTVLGIAGSGDQALQYIYEGAAEYTPYDISLFSAIHFAIKTTLAKNLNFTDYLDFLGNTLGPGVGLINEGYGALKKIYKEFKKTIDEFNSNGVYLGDAENSFKLYIPRLYEDLIKESLQNQGTSFKEKIVSDFFKYVFLNNIDASQLREKGIAYKGFARHRMGFADDIFNFLPYISSEDEFLKFQENIRAANINSTHLGPIENLVEEDVGSFDIIDTSNIVLAVIAEEIKKYQSKYDFKGFNGFFDLGIKFDDKFMSKVDHDVKKFLDNCRTHLNEEGMVLVETLCPKFYQFLPEVGGFKKERTSNMLTIYIKR